MRKSRPGNFGDFRARSYQATKRGAERGTVSPAHSGGLSQPGYALLTPLGPVRGVKVSSAHHRGHFGRTWRRPGLPDSQHRRSVSQDANLSATATMRRPHCCGAEDALRAFDNTLTL